MPSLARQETYRWSRSSMNLKITVLFLAIFLGLCASDDPCNIVCGREYDPICGVSQGILKTFSNPCMMVYFNCLKGANYAKMYRGECSEDIHVAEYDEPIQIILK